MYFKNLGICKCVNEILLYEKRVNFIDIYSLHYQKTKREMTALDRF